MTYREKLIQEHPGINSQNYVEMGCPENWGYPPSGCVGFDCAECWDRLVEDEGEQVVTVKVMLDPGAIMPTRAHSTDAGLDLYSPERKVIRPNDFVRIDTGVHVEIPTGYVGMITSKSGLMAKEGITSRGTIDSGYVGSIQAVLFNHSGKTYIVEQGQKITQLVLLPIITPELELVDGLEETERGNSGFGSTGIF